MKETGIIMSGSHPRLILLGKKTMTRRTWGLEKINEDPDRWVKCSPLTPIDVSNPNSPVVCSTLWQFEAKDGELLVVKCPYGQVGDWLWCKEIWAISSFSANFTKEQQLQVAYKAGVKDIDHPDGMDHDLEWRNVDYQTWQKYAQQKYRSWHSPRFMPRWACRITREIKTLRAERLQEITEEDAEAEGLKYHIDDFQPGCSYMVTAREKFRDLWDSLNEKRYPWRANPWVWPIGWSNETVKVGQ